MTRLIIALGLFGSLFAVGHAQASEYGSFVVENPSRTTIRYQVKWGDNDWRSYDVPPGYTRSHYTPLDENGNVPKPYVRFDYIGGDDEVTYKTYNVGVYATYIPDRGKRYVFRYSGCGRYVDLYVK